MKNPEYSSPAGQAVSAAVLQQAFRE